jgi:hypothetical protein
MTQPADFIQVEPNGSPYFCDWYSCLVSDEPDNIIEALDEPMGLLEVKPCSGVPQYEHSVALWSHQCSDRPMFELSYGGNQGAAPHLVSKGYVAHDAMKVLRRVIPSHRVGRMDIAVDLKPVPGGPPLYDTVSEILHQLHRMFGLKTRTINHDVPAMGRTHYLGSRESVAMVRLYEKDKEQASKGLSFIPGLVRLELEVKPQKQGDRARWASVSLEQAWGVTTWAQILAARVLSLKAQAIRRAPPMKRTDLEAFRGLLAQHVKLIQRLDEEEAVAMLREMYSHGTKALAEEEANRAAMDEISRAFRPVQGALI